MVFNPFEWWEKWHPDKAPGQGRNKPTGGKAGTGKAPTVTPKVKAKKTIPPKKK